MGSRGMASEGAPLIWQKRRRAGLHGDLLRLGNCSILTAAYEHALASLGANIGQGMVREQFAFEGGTFRDTVDQKFCYQRARARSHYVA